MTKFKQYFLTKLTVYKSQGATALQNDLPELLSWANLPTAKKPFIHFVVDILMDLKKYRQAIALLKRIEAQYGISDIGFNNLAYCHWELESTVKALAYYKQSLEHNPANVSSLRGACYLATDSDDPDAVNFCKRFVEAQEGDAEAAIWYAIALRETNRYTELNSFISQYQAEFGENQELDAFRHE